MFFKIWIVIPFQSEEPAQVWASIFKGAGDLLVEVLNKQYSINLKANHLILNTTELGYFDSMKAGVDSGLCDICTSNVSFFSDVVVIEMMMY